ncbi:hypothetical protein AS034_08785 [[Bacillus] enclensis]|nr:hypothetical protein AS034_08785 [[Bacillus] enclensis]
MSKPKRQKTPFRLAHLMLVASGQAASAFLFVQLQGLEAHVISQLVQEGKKRLHGRFALCHPSLSKAPPLFPPAGAKATRRLTGYPRKAKSCTEIISVV